MDETTWKYERPVETLETALIPLERELLGRVEWFIRLRWAAGSGILIGSWVVQAVFPSSVQVGALWVAGVAILVYNGLLIGANRRWGQQRRDQKRFVFLQIALDWAALIVIVHYTGGLLSPVTLGFSFHLIIGAFLLSRRSCYLLAGAAGVLLGGLGVVERWLYWDPPRLVGFPADSAADSGTRVALWIVLSIFFVGVTYLATSITARLRQREQALYQSERDLGQAYADMEALYDLGQMVNSTLDLNEVLSLIAEHAVKLLRAKACFIRLFDVSGERLYIGGAYGFSQAYVNKGPVELSKSRIDSETLRGGVVQVYEVSQDQRFQYPEEARKEGLRSVLCVPVTAKARVLGVLRTYTAEPHLFSEQEQSLLKNLANLGAVAIENARAYEDLKAAHEERLWFARTTHHQLRSPLAAIQSTLNALPFAGELNESQRDLVRRAGRRVEDAFELIRDLLDLAAAQRPWSEPGEERVGLLGALGPTLERFRESAEAKGLQFQVESPGTERWVAVVAADLERIFSNLLDNAVKYTPAGGRVSFGVTDAGDRIQLTVRDSGIGIPPQDQARVFEGFFRGQGAKESGALGTGLGLSIVQSLVHRWGGELELSSREGQGTWVTVRLPQAVAPPSVSVAEESHNPGSPEGDGTRPKADPEPTT